MKMQTCIDVQIRKRNDRTTLTVWSYPVVIINWVQYLGPPGPFSFPDSRDLLEVLGRLSWQRERGGSLGDPPGP